MHCESHPIPYDGLAQKTQQEKCAQLIRCAILRCGLVVTTIRVSARQAQPCIQFSSFHRAQEPRDLAQFIGFHFRSPTHRGECIGTTGRFAGIKGGAGIEPVAECRGAILLRQVREQRTLSLIFVRPVLAIERRALKRLVARQGKHRSA